MDCTFLRRAGEAAVAQLSTAVFFFYFVLLVIKLDIRGAHHLGL